MEWGHLTTQAIEIAKQAGEIIRQNWDEERKIQKKGRIDLVTDTDTASEEFLKTKLGELFPECRFLAEESAKSQTLGEEPVWIIDPLDGTTNFAHHIPLVAVSIALWQGGETVLGIVHLPLLRETFHAEKNQGAFLNQAPIHTTATEELEDALVATGFPYTVDRDIQEILYYLRRILVSARGVRRPGSAAIDLAYTACGRYEAFYEMGLKPWDTAAGYLLVREAGGRITRFDGREYTPGDRDILATNSAIHPVMLEMLSKDWEGKPKNN